MPQAVRRQLFPRADPRGAGQIEGWVDPDLPVRDADAVGRQVASSLARQLPEADSLTWTIRAGPA